MKTLDEIQAIPNIKLLFPSEDSGVARLKLASSTHPFLARIVFSWHSGFDVVQVMFKRKKPPTYEEMYEVAELFFKKDEISQCNLIPNPHNDRATVLYREQTKD